MYKIEQLTLLNVVNSIVQLLDETEQNIVIYQCQWRADQLFADAEGKGKLICEPLINHDILR